MNGAPTSFVCVLMPGPHTCAFCGEWVHIEGGDIFRDGVGFCGVECVDAYEDGKAETEYRRLNGAPDWCHDCGFDRYEHADDCPMFIASDPGAS